MCSYEENNLERNLCQGVEIGTCNIFFSEKRCTFSIVDVTFKPHSSDPYNNIGCTWASDILHKIL